MFINLMQGDCLERMREIPHNSVDLTVTSPPYDNLRTYNGNNDLWNDEVWKGVIENLYAKTKPGGVVVWVVGDATVKGSETGTSFKQAIHAIECGFNLHDTMIWSKPNPIPRSHKRYEQAFEYMFVFTKGPPATWNPYKVPSKLAGSKRTGTIQKDTSGVRTKKNVGGVVSDEKVCSNVWDMSGKSITDHPAEFPIKLCERHITSWSNEGDVVFDPFLGSGTTGVAAKNLGRSFIGIELCPTYFHIAKERVEGA